VAEREVALGLAAEIISAHVSNNAPCKLISYQGDSAGVQHAIDRRAKVCCTASARTGSSGDELCPARSRYLS
jgi:hypothetical protein